MSGPNPFSYDLLPKPTSPSRPATRHQIKRSITELAVPVKLPRHHQNLSRKDRSGDDKALSPTYQQMTMRYSLDMPRSHAATPAMSPNESRRASLLVPSEEDVGIETRVGEEERLREEQQKAAIRNDGLRQSLVDLDTFSTNATRRLDKTYYEVLEKMSTLQNTIMALKDLAETSRDTKIGFEKESRELEHDIVRQLGAAGHFDEQQTRITSLRSRIYSGRHKIQSLSERVDIVRERVEGWERADREWQERTRKRLKIIWTVMSVLVLVVIVLSVSAQYIYPDRDGPGASGGRSVNRTASASLQNGSKQGESPSEGEGRVGLLWKTPMDDGERLRVFDEL